VHHGRRVRSETRNRSARTATSGRAETQRIREWATANGYSPNFRGRISQNIKKAYDDAHA
jgi:hypothetical protein